MIDWPLRAWTVDRVPHAERSEGVRSFVSTVPADWYRNHERLASPRSGAWSGYVTARERRYST